jgi:hypothetical protein
MVSQITQHIEEIQRDARRLAKRAHGWIEPVARIGYAAKGTVYCLIGLLAVLAAIGLRHGVADQRGVMKTLLAQPFGKVMLLAMAVGLACYTVWYFIQALLDPDRDGTDWKSLGKRAGKLFKGFFHAGLVLAIVRLLMGLGSDDSTDATARDWTAWLMAFPLGIWLVGATGAGFLGYGIYQLYRAWRIKLDHQLDLKGIGAASRKLFIFFSRFGLFARGILFGTIGVFLLVAAMRADPHQARGVAAAMKALEAQPYGAWLLAAVALGLFSYGVYEFLRAKYRKIG